MAPTEEARRAAEQAEVALHGKVKEIMVAERVPYIDALETAWYDPENAKLVEACRAVVGDDEDPDVDGPMLPVDAGIEVGKRARAYIADRETDQEAALIAILFTDPKLKSAWEADLKLGAA